MANVSQLYKYEKLREVYAFMINASKRRKEIVQFFSKKWTKDGCFLRELVLPVSLLGHAGLKHTEKYTRVVDELKRQAVKAIDL